MARRGTTEPRNDRIELRTSPREKALLVRAAQLEHLDLTSFVLRSALPQAESIVAAADRVQMSEPDILFVLDLIENPPPPGPRLIAAAERRRRSG